ncbi:ketopantoate reductase family protein [Acuticoccus sp.]|uniref:ketopantoate reductase family protein n=1 Tax=Acuticoccus sp. TaxID=1904378 RepID=UPI003B519B0C
MRALHLTDVQQLSKEAPVDLAFVCVKSYDTAWAATLIAQYLVSGGAIVSLQNCMNEETIAGIVGWGKTLGSIASLISVELSEPGHVHRGIRKGGAAHTVFRVGEVHGRATKRAKEVCRLVGYSDSAIVTDNLWGERWSKLVANSMQNGLSACTGSLEMRWCRTTLSGTSRHASAARQFASVRRWASRSRRSCTSNRR